MSEVEKLYENAGIKSLPTCNNCNMLDEYWSNGTYCSTCKCDKDNDECGMANYIYPPFTAEKQLNLLKWLSISQGILIKQNTIFIGFESGKPKDLICSQNKDAIFEESLAGLINFLWQSLTDVEKEQIKEILNG